MKDIKGNLGESFMGMNSLYYFYNFSISLKSIKNQTFKKHVHWKNTALNGVCLPKKEMRSLPLLFWTPDCIQKTYTWITFLNIVPPN